jgi:signal transduction histidine kinase
MQIDRSLLKASWRSWYGNDLVTVGPGWLQLLWTLLFSFMVGLGFFVLGVSTQVIGSGRWPSPAGLLQWFIANQVIAQLIGFTIHGLFAAIIPLVGVKRIRAFNNRQRAVFFSAIPMAGVSIGWPVGAVLLGHAPGGWSFLDRPAVVAGMVLMSLLICFVFYQHFDAKARQFEAEKRAAEAQLRLLQGQMEPHFMFNTLANVSSLIDVDAPKAKQLLEAFVDYLRASLGRLREGDSTLDEELAMSQAYLALMQCRMGQRLAFRFEIAEPGLRRAVMPPLLLQPLVENAIHHGLECKVEGGTIHVKARRTGSHLVIEVEDDGLGQREQPARRTGSASNGVALDNLRARLQSRWGQEAALSLELHPDAGARATLRLPFETSSC